MPMSKPVLLREQCGTKASAVGAKAAQHKQQQPLRLEEELAFGEVQWTQVILIIHGSRHTDLRCWSYTYLHT